MTDWATRLLVASATLALWLALLTSRQTALYPTVAEPAVEFLPAWFVLGAIALAVVGRVFAGSTIVAVVCMAVLTCGIGLLAAQLGAPLANASEGQVGGGYCGDFCRTAIMGRFVAYFGWPPLAAILLVLLARLDRSNGPTHDDRAGWSRAWATAVLVLGSIASAVWWGVILPNG